MSSPTSEKAPGWTLWSRGSGGSSSSSPEAPRVGRDGRLRLAFAARGGRTVLTGRRFTLPLQALEPMDLDGGGALALMLLNPTGGVLGGDVLETDVTLGPGSHVVLTTPSATRVYRSAGPAAVQAFRATVSEGAALEWVPDHLIPSPGARLRQSTSVTLAEGGTAMILDGWAAGRIARGEGWAFGELDLTTTLRDARGPIFHERARLPGEPSLGGLGHAEGMGYVATLVAAAPGRGGWAALADECAARLSASLPPDAGRWGVTELGRAGMAARLLLRSAPALQVAVEGLWAVCRRRLLGLGPLCLRKL